MDPVFLILLQKSIQIHAAAQVFNVFFQMIQTSCNEQFGCPRCQIIILENLIQA
jgi:hypothetical protein